VYYRAGESEKLNVGIMKELSGGDKINAEPFNLPSSSSPSSTW
jgi:hypothetical protein